MILPIERPSESGRAQIFRIHSRRMKDLGYLADDVDMLTLAKHTAFYSGAEVEGVVKAAFSIAMEESLVAEGASSLAGPCCLVGPSAMERLFKQSLQIGN